jgi:phosphoglycolate phosphatase
MPRHVLFDLDGTLIDSAPSILESYRLVLNQFKIAPKLPLEKIFIGPIDFPVKQTGHK